jgi:hypothetical protein
LVALKKIKVTSREEGIPSTAMREVALLKEMSHPNVIKYGMHLETLELALLE